MNPWTGTGQFKQRFALAAFPDGGVLLDLDTGQYFRLNPTATDICRALERGTSQEEVEVQLANRFGIPRAQAAVDVRQMLSGLSATAPRKEYPSDFKYRPTEFGYAVCDETGPVLEVARDGSRLRLVRDVATLTCRIEDCVRGILPKALFLAGIPALHASACVIGGRLTAFSGVSTAGKTTTARAFVSHGARPVSEDVLVLSLDGGRPAVFIEAEVAVHRWARDAAAALVAGGQGSEIDCDGLAATCGGPTEALAVAAFLDRARRGGDTIRTERVSRPDAVACYLEGIFLGAGDRDSWRRYLKISAALATGVDTCLAWVPDGLTGLAEAAAAYSASSTS